MLAPTAEYLPAAQLTQLEMELVAPVIPPKAPAAQVAPEHDDCPVAAWKYPAPQLEHALAPELEYFPAAQSDAQAALEPPLTPKVPAMQLAHAVAPTVAE